MRQESKSIFDFKAGDIVTRIQPTSTISGGIDYMQPSISYDCSYIGEKLVFIGIANGCAYFEVTESFSYLLEKGKPISLGLHKFSEGWSHYIDPRTLVDAKPASKYASMSDSTLVVELDGAIAEEKYEEASRIQHEIDNRDI